MSITFRGGRGNMRCAGEFSQDIANVANANGILILTELSIEPQTKDGLVGKVPIKVFIKKCSAWLNEDLEKHLSSKDPSLDLEYLAKKIGALMVEAIKLASRKEPFTHICWS